MVYIWNFFFYYIKLDRILDNEYYDPVYSFDQIIQNKQLSIHDCILFRYFYGDQMPQGSMNHES